MVNLMRRRREMMQMATPPVPYWDYEWDYTKGKLEEQTGWSYTILRTASSEMVSDGEKLLAPSNNSYINLYMPEGNPNRSFSSGYGTLEVKCYGVWWNNNYAVNLRITAAISSTKRVTLFVFGNQWRIFDNATKANCTVLQSASNNTKYTIKIVMKDTVADIYINGTLVAANVSTSSTVYGSSNSVMQQNSESANRYGVIQYFKLKHGAA